MILQKIPSSLLLKNLLVNGGNFSELFFEHSSKTMIVHEDKKIDALSSGIDQGIGLRRIQGPHTSYGFTNDLDPKVLTELSHTITGSNTYNTKKSDINFKKIKPSFQLTIKKNPNEVTLADKINTINQAANMAWGMDKKIVQVRIAYSDLVRHIEIANSLGEEINFSTTLSVLSISITASEGNLLQRGSHSLGGHIGYEFLTQADVEEAVKTAVKRALLNLSAKPASGGIMPVVISAEAGGTIVHEAIGHGLEADLACDGMSVYEGKLGEKVAHEKITVVEDPTLPGKRGSYLFDDEGIPAQRVELIKNGVLQHYMHNRLTAEQAGVTPNSHGRRESYAHRPVVRMANTMIAPGNDNPEEIIQSVDRGLLVKMMGGGEVNTVNGDFMFEVTEGYLIENGKIGEPVRGATLTGNGPEIIKIIDKVGDDLGFSIGTCGKDGQDAPVSDAMPTVRIPQIVVGGVVD